MSQPTAQSPSSPVLLTASEKQQKKIKGNTTTESFMSKVTSVAVLVWSAVRRFFIFLCLIFKFMGQKVVNFTSALRRPDNLNSFLQRSINLVTSFEQRTLQWMDNVMKAEGSKGKKELILSQKLPESAGEKSKEVSVNPAGLGKTVLVREQQQKVQQQQQHQLQQQHQHKQQSKISISSVSGESQLIKLTTSSYVKEEAEQKQLVGSKLADSVINIELSSPDRMYLDSSMEASRISEQNQHLTQLTYSLTSTMTQDNSEGSLYSKVGESQFQVRMEVEEQLLEHGVREEKLLQEKMNINNAQGQECQQQQQAGDERPVEAARLHLQSIILLHEINRLKIRSNERASNLLNTSSLMEQQLSGQRHIVESEVDEVIMPEPESMEIEMARLNMQVIFLLEEINRLNDANLQVTKQKEEVKLCEVGNSDPVEDGISPEMTTKIALYSLQRQRVIARIKQLQANYHNSEIQEHAQKQLEQIQEENERLQQQIKQLRQQKIKGE